MVLFQKKNKAFTAIAIGQSIPIEEVPDEVFSSKMMGDGIAIIPEVGKIYAPCDGVISMVMDRTKHAVGIQNEDGMELLVHVGLDTVTLKGEGFHVHVAQGDHIATGDLLLEFDAQKLAAAGINIITMLVIVESNGHLPVKKYFHQHVDKNSMLLEYR